MTFSVSILERSHVLRSCLPTRELRMAEQLSKSHGKNGTQRVRKWASLASYWSPDLAGYKYTPKVKYVISLTLLTAWLSVLGFGPCKDKIIPSKCMNTSFSQPYLLLKLLQSLSFIEVHHKYPGQVAEDIHSAKLVKNCRSLAIFVTNSLPQNHFLVAAWWKLYGLGTTIVY